MCICLWVLLTEALRDRWSGAPPLGVGARTPALLRRCALGDLRQGVLVELPLLDGTRHGYR